MSPGRAGVFKHTWSAGFDFELPTISSGSDSHSELHIRCL